MKTFIGRISLYCTALAILASLAISCQKEATQQHALDKETSGLQKENGVITRDSLVSLAKRMYKTGIENEYPEIDKAYKSLSPDDLKRFFEVRKEVDMQRTVASAKPGTNIPLLKLEVAAGADFRIEVNLAAIEKYKKGINTLTGKELDDLAIPIFQKPAYALLRHRGSNTNAKEAGIASCTSADYDLTATTKSGWGTGTWWYGCTSMASTRSPNDCDYEYRYDGVYPFVRANDFNTYTLLVAPSPVGFGDRVSRRKILYSDGYDTGILLGATRTEIVVGHYTNVTMCGVQ